MGIKTIIVRYWLTLVMLFMGNLLFAEDLFKVMLTERAYRHSVSLRSYESIYTGDTLVVRPTGYVALIHKNGKTVELNHAGIYCMDSIAKIVGHHSSPQSVKSFSFLASFSNKIYRNVEFNGHYHSAEELRVYALSKTYIIHDTLMICWQPSEHVQKYKVVVCNFFDEEVAMLTTSDPYIRINMNDELYRRDGEKKYIIRIHNQESENITPDGMAIIYMLPEEEEEIHKDIQEYKSINPEYTVPNLLLEAAFYEEHKLFFSAINKYQQAIALRPDTEDLQIMYVNFMIRNGILSSEDR